VSRSETQSLYKTKKRTQQEKEGDETRESKGTGQTEHPVRAKFALTLFICPHSTHVMPMNRAVREVSEGGEGNIKKIVLVFPSSSEPD